MRSSSNSTVHLCGQTIDSGHIQLISVLGSGGFGTVYQARTTGTAKELAVKVVARRMRTRHLARREVELHSRVSVHPGIATLHRAFLERKSLCLVFDAHLGGDLHSAVVERALYFYRDERAKDALLQILDAVEFCHAQGVFHRDLKPQNFLLSADGSTIVLTDFGLATMHAVSKAFEFGTRGYMAPEVLNVDFAAKSYSPRLGDIWSLGVLTLFLLTGRAPWRAAVPADREYAAFRAHPSHLRVRLPLSHSAVSLAERVLDADASARPSIPLIRKWVARTRTFFMGPETLGHESVRVRELVSRTLALQARGGMSTSSDEAPSDLVTFANSDASSSAGPVTPDALVTTVSDDRLLDAVSTLLLPAAVSVPPKGGYATAAGDVVPAIMQSGERSRRLSLSRALVWCKTRVRGAEAP